MITHSITSFVDFVFSFSPIYLELCMNCTACSSREARSSSPRGDKRMNLQGFLMKSINSLGLKSPHDFIILKIPALIVFYPSRDLKILQLFRMNWSAYIQPLRIGLLS